MGFRETHDNTYLSTGYEVGYKISRDKRLKRVNSGVDLLWDKL